MKTIRVTLLVVVVWSVVTLAQGPIVTSTNVAFDVTSVKPNNSGSTSSSTMKPSTVDCTPLPPGAPTKCGMNDRVERPEPD